MRILIKYSEKLCAYIRVQINNIWRILSLSYIHNIGNNAGGDHCAVWGELK